MGKSPRGRGHRSGDVCGPRRRGHGALPGQGEKVALQAKKWGPKIRISEGMVKSGGGSRFVTKSHLEKKAFRKENNCGGFPRSAGGFRRMCSHRKKEGPMKFRGIGKKKVLYGRAAQKNAPGKEKRGATLPSHITEPVGRLWEKMRGAENVSLFGGKIRSFPNWGKGGS